MRHVARIALFIVGVSTCVVVYLFLNGILPRDSRDTFLGVLPALILALGVFVLNAIFFRWDGSSVKTLGAGGFRRELPRMGIWVFGRQRTRFRMATHHCCGHEVPVADEWRISRHQRCSYRCILFFKQRCPKNWPIADTCWFVFTTLWLSSRDSRHVGRVLR